eukprot:gene30902-8052_t
MGVGESTGLALSARYEARATASFAQGWGLSGLVSAGAVADTVLSYVAMLPAAAIPVSYFLVLPPCPTADAAGGGAGQPMGQAPLSWRRRRVSLLAARPDLVALFAEHAQRYLIMAAVLPRLSLSPTSYATYNLVLLSALTLRAAGPESKALLMAARITPALRRAAPAAAVTPMAGAAVTAAGIVAGTAFQVAAARMRARVPADGVEFTLQFASLANQKGGSQS